LCEKQGKPVTLSGVVMKAVIDTSVFVPTLLSSRGVGVWLIALWKEKRFELVISPALLEELVDVLERPGIRERIKSQRSLALLRRLRDNAIWVEGNSGASGLSDAEDDFLLAAALESGASFIVTWDRKLLDQAACQGVRMINPDQFTSLLVRMG
jgi:putative PIN family toxin of toxin-antitoxin system